MRFNLRLNLIEELKVIKAVQDAQPHCLFILDANEKYTLEEALIVLEKLDGMIQAENSTHNKILSEKKLPLFFGLSFIYNTVIRTLYCSLHAEMAIKPILFEQPVHRDDWNGLANVRGIAREKYGIHVSADESCQSLIDVQKVVQDDIVDFVNVKLARFGVLGSLQVVEVARKSGLSLIIDSMVETRLASGFAGHLACGLGCFK